MRRNLSWAAATLAVLALATLASGASMASGSGASSRGGDGQGHETIVLTSTEISSAFLDLGEGEPPAQADQFVFADTLTKGGETVGEDGGSCTFTHVASPDAITANCIESLSLERGQITVQGLVTFDGSGGAGAVEHAAVTGGTGAYNGIGGELTIEPISENVDRLTLRLER